MKRFVLLLAALALVLAAAVPAIAQVEQGFEQETESGGFEAEFATTNEGDNSSVCAPALQFGNTGNLQNAQGVTQYASEAGDIGFGGASESFGPSLSTSCDQPVQQSSAASSQ